MAIMIINIIVRPNSSILFLISITSTSCVMMCKRTEIEYKIFLTSISWTSFK